MAYLIVFLNGSFGVFFIAVFFLTIMYNVGLGFNPSVTYGSRISIKTKYSKITQYIFNTKHILILS